MKRIKFFHPLFLLFAFLTAQAVNEGQNSNHYREASLFRFANATNKEPGFARIQSEHWAKKVLDTLTVREKIGQLFMVAAYSNRGPEHEAELKMQIEKYGIGGLIFFQGGPGRQLNMHKRLSKSSKLPLLIGIDAEWGLNMRLDSTYGIQRNMVLGATQNPILAQEAGAAIGAQCRALDIDINFAPVCDVNSNAANPVINSRSFGEDRFWVAKLSGAFARGMESSGVMACAKHFPGHGDTDSDSHKTLPTVGHGLARLDSIELYPFKYLFKAGVSSVMVAHLNVPAMEPSGLPSTLSSKIVHGWLKDSLNYKGLIFTDALNMKGVADAYPAGITDLKALQAGADVLLFPLDVPKAIAEIEAAILRGDIPMDRLDEACLKILKAKQHQMEQAFVDTPSMEEIKSPKSMESLRTKIAEASITLLKNEANLPIDPLDKDVAVIGVGRGTKPFLNVVEDLSAIPTGFAENPYSNKPLIAKLSKRERVVLVMDGSQYKGKSNYGLGPAELGLISELAPKTKLILVWMGNPYALTEMPENLLGELKGLVLGYQDIKEQHLAAAKALLGVIPFKGKLPVTLNKQFVADKGETTSKETGFIETFPEKVGMDGIKLQEIDAYIQKQIKDKATPGCRIVVLRKGKMVYNKSFGHYTYANNQPVNRFSIYDLASLTKVLSTGLAVMKLHEEGVLDIGKTLGDYLAWIPRDSPYAKLVLSDVMLHQAGLQGWIPYFQDYIDPTPERASLVNQNASSKHPVQVAKDYFVVSEMRDSIFARILREPLRKKTDYLYSDLGFYFLKEIVETITGKPLNVYVAETFYQPMGLKSMTYLPREKFSEESIVPTEYDALWRKQLVHGFVHDQGAALLGGVGGHAGLFGSAEDVAAIMQMLLDGGSFNGQQFLKSSTVEFFTAARAKNPDDNRRGLIFDKPVRDGGPGPTFDGISFNSFGHSGFTGTLAWADPDEEIVYVFLSNRIYPSAENKKLIRNNVRSTIQEMIYEAIIDSKNEMAAQPKP
ncbi:glycoside hydrolase family 3 N-terminal domain-containing protein [Luteibaculum oceani]|nr:glycoside hydrolase family 3 N-terminal domain-containing protein [Luteibaculum oceani]